MVQARLLLASTPTAPLWRRRPGWATANAGLWCGVRQCFALPLWFGLLFLSCVSRTEAGEARAAEQGTAALHTRPPNTNSRRGRLDSCGSVRILPPTRVPFGRGRMGMEAAIRRMGVV